MTDKTRINIMTSCDDNLTQYIFVQLRTIAMHLRDKEVHFYLFYHRIPEESLEKLEIYCECLGNITFHRIFVEPIEQYLEIARIGAKLEPDSEQEPRWPYEAYFVFACHRYLPQDVTRILYIDAGDVIFTGGIDEFYFDDFEGKSLIVSPVISKPDKSYFTASDLSDKENFSYIVGGGIFNSGSFMINVDMFRKENISIYKIIEISEMIIDRLKGSANDFDFNDQGLLSVVFIDKMKYFKYADIKDLWYKPYNFTMFFYKKDDNDKIVKELWYDPKIIHFVGGGIKPWLLMIALIKDGLVRMGQKITTNEIVQIASNTKLGDLMHTFSTEPNRRLIEPEMAPFYEYWYEINNLVQIELSEIFD